MHEEALSRIRLPSHREHLRAADLRKAADCHHRLAEEYFKLAQASRDRADEIAFGEFGRRELNAARRLEQCAALYENAVRHN